MRDNIFITGDVKLVLTNSDGVVIETMEYKNLVVSTGKTFIASRMAGNSATVMSHIALGTGATAAVVGDSALVSEIGRASITSSTPSTNTITYTATFGPGVATGTLTEAGVFNAASAGTMLCRTVFPPVGKAAGDSFAISWTVTVN